MPFHVLDPNLADFLNGLDDEHVYQLFDVKAGLLDSRCLVLYGNEEMYLLAYARAMISMYFRQDVLNTETQNNEALRAKSNYHYELDYGPGCIDFVKSINKNTNLAGHKRVFVIRGLASSPNQHQLKYLMDSNASYVIVSKTVGNIDPAILSRALMLRLSFDRDRLARFLEKYNIQVPAAGKSIVCAIAKVGEKNYEKKLKELLGLMTSEIKQSEIKQSEIKQSEIKIARAIKEYCLNIHQKCIPVSVIGRKIISYMSEHPNIYEIVSACAFADHAMAIGTKEILNYEQMLVNVWQVACRKKSF
jgi:2-hydroxy-3-keto-5-methylthiopentenyl-1-phosphate phosphatase